MCHFAYHTSPGVPCFALCTVILFCINALTAHTLYYRTEFHLYWSYASHACIFDDYHVVGNILLEDAIWSEQEFQSWEPCNDRWKPGMMNLVQSRMKLNPSQIWDKLQPCLHDRPGKYKHLSRLKAGGLL